jgi:TPR repeat protein
MTGREGRAAAKREREQRVEEKREVKWRRAKQEQEDELPLAMLAVVKSRLDTLTKAQLRNSQGGTPYFFVSDARRVTRPFAGAPVYDMSLTPAERLHAMGCGFKGKIVQLLALRSGHQFQPQQNWPACHRFMQMTVRRVASKHLAAMRDCFAKEAEELCALGQCAAALLPLQRAICLMDSKSLAQKAWLLIEGREGCQRDEAKAFELATRGVRLGCHHCQGVLAMLHWTGYAGTDLMLEEQSIELASISARAGSKYGQFALGRFQETRVRDAPEAIRLYRLAAAQHLDTAQCVLAYYACEPFMDDLLDPPLPSSNHANAQGEAAVLFRRAAVQGYPPAQFWLAKYQQDIDPAEAALWYIRAQAAGTQCIQPATTFF